MKSQRIASIKADLKAKVLELHKEAIRMYSVLNLVPEMEDRLRRTIEALPLLETRARSPEFLRHELFVFKDLVRQMKRAQKTVERKMKDITGMDMRHLEALEKQLDRLIKMMRGLNKSGAAFMKHFESVAQQMKAMK